MVSRASLILLLILLIGCRPATPPPTASDVPPTASGSPNGSVSSPVVPTSIVEQVNKIRNSEYQLGASDALRSVQLTEGTFEQGTPGSDDFMSIMVTDFVAVGDLTGDGEDEAAALVSENYGGTGVFVFLTVYSNINGAWTFQTSTMVDDRPLLQELSIASQEIYLDAVIHGMEDPMCCPALHTTRHYRLVDNQLDRVDFATFTPEDKPRTIEISSPLNGSDVFSSVQIQGKVAISPFENNLVYRIFDVSGIELSAGALAVAAERPGGPGTFDAIISLGNAISGSIIRIEVQDLSAADGSLLAMDSVELVVK